MQPAPTTQDTQSPDNQSPTIPALHPDPHDQTQSELRPRLRSRDLAITLVTLPILLLVVLWVAIYTHGTSFGLSIYVTITRLYFTGTIVFPLALLVFSLIALACWARLRTRGLAAASLFLFITALAAFSSRIYATHIEPYRLQVRTISIASPKVNSPIRIVHTSDIQTPAITDYERRVFETIRSLKPDLVINTGDLIQPLPPDTYDRIMPEMDRLLRSLAPPFGIFNAHGDTDDPMRDAFRQGFGGMRTLYDEPATLDIRGTRLSLFGMSLNTSSASGSRTVIDRWFASSGVPPSGGMTSVTQPVSVPNKSRQGRPNIAQHVSAGNASGNHEEVPPGTTEIDNRSQSEKTQPAPFTILFGHRPDFIMHVQNMPIDLCLAGHTHAGQVRLPFYGALMTEARIPRELAWGFHEVGATRLNVSAAVGCEHIFGVPPLRVNCPPELVVIDLVPE